MLVLELTCEMLAYSTVSRGPFVERLGRDAGMALGTILISRSTMLHSIPRL